MAKKKPKASGGYNTLRNRLGHYILGAVLMTAGPVMSLFALPGVLEGRASVQWPTTKGTVTEAKLWETQDRTGTHFETKVRYNFNVDGKFYSGDRLKIGGKATSSMEDAQADLKRYGQIDGKVELHYNPSDPSHCTVETGETMSNLLVVVAAGPGIFLLGVLLVAIGGLMSFLAKKPEPEAAEDEEDEEDEDAEQPKSKKTKRREDAEDELPPKKAKRRPVDDDDDGEDAPRQRKPRLLGDS